MPLLWSTLTHLDPTRSQENRGGSAIPPSQAHSGKPVLGSPGRPTLHQSHTVSAPYPDGSPTQPAHCKTTRSPPAHPVIPRVWSLLAMQQEELNSKSPSGTFSRGPVLATDKPEIRITR